MALDTYAHLQTALGDLLNRSDLTAQIPDFIGLAEADIRRRLRIFPTSATITTTTSTLTLPADCRELLSVRTSSATPSADAPLIISTADVVEEARQSMPTTGRPRMAYVLNNALILAPTPDQSYNFFVTYYRTLPSLTTTTHNEVLDDAPDVYLYGALVHAAVFLEHDERVPIWKGLYEDAVFALKKDRDARNFGASFRRARLPRVF